MLRRLIMVLCLLLPWSVAAQEAATLVADRVEIQADSVLVADGNVEVLHQGRRLKAQRVTYDSKADRLIIEGPLVLTDGQETRLLADQADMSADLTEGILRGARLVLGQQLQLAATEVQRIGGRYTELGRTVASSCQVCAANPVPLWEIRASRVVHDEQARQIFFQDAQLRVAGVPVFYIPRLRMPDPTLTRATGFLQPEIRSTSELGTGVGLPYFIVLDDSRDLTVTPFLSTRQGRSLGLRYRQAFRTGRIEIDGAISKDEIRPDDTRGYLFATGAFTLPNAFGLAFGVQVASDNGYLRDYGISSQDRLDSYLLIQRVRRDEIIFGRLLHLDSLRDDNSEDSRPSTILDTLVVRRFEPPLVGGTATLRYQASAESRASDSLTDGNNDGISDGRDTARGLVRLDWRRDWLLPAGVIATALGRGQADVTTINQDPAYPSQITRFYGVGGAELRWPLTRQEAGGATQVLEPVIQVVYAPDSSEDVPNDDSLLVAFDEGNLFALDRFPGTDAVELGSRMAVGLAWSRFGTDGGTVGLAMGKIFRADDLDQFGVSTGLDGTRSDWLLGARVETPGGISLTQRLLINDEVNTTLAEARLGWVRPDFGIFSSYFWSIADPAIGQPDPISELSVFGSIRIADNWNGRFGVRHDFIEGRTSRANLGLEFRNECLLVDLSLSRWFADSTNVTPTTEFGLAIDLLGFGGSAAPGPARRCRS